MTDIKAAVIGVGAMGKNHARVYSELDGVELVGVCDADKGIAQRVSERYRCECFGSYKDLISKLDVDVASIVVPTNLHSAVAIDCVMEKINVLIEKPIADTVKNGLNIINAAKSMNVKLTVGHIERFNPAVIELKRRIDAGDLGKIYKVSAQRVGPFPERIRDVGVVIDLATHDIDVMRYLLGSDITRVYGESSRSIHTTHEDLMNAVLKFANDAIGILDVNWLTPEKIRELAVIGEKGMFVAKYLSQELFFHQSIDAKLNNYDYSDILMGVAGGDVVDIRIKKAEPLKAELASFVKCVRDGSEPVVSGEDGLHALRIACALMESSSENTVVCI